MKGEPLKIKICGLREAQNIEEIAALKPDYMGFIFYEKSPRFAGARLNMLQLRNFDSAVRKVGVFVDQSVEEIVRRKDEYFLDVVQLHGHETPETCRELRAAVPGMDLIKAFHVKPDFDFSETAAYAPHCRLFLFDTACSGFGGSGLAFDWSLLERYGGETPFLLSGGIGRTTVREAVKLLQQHPRGAGIDVNSGVETAPGVKSLALAAEIVREIRR